MITPPKIITIKSDGNVLTFKETITPKAKGETHFIYQYTTSKTKLSQYLGLTEKELQKLIEVNS